jgi:hypothetical protein
MQLAIGRISLLNDTELRTPIKTSRHKLKLKHVTIHVYSRQMAQRNKSSHLSFIAVRVCSVPLDIDAGLWPEVR